jgi:hypothetical protein
MTTYYIPEIVVTALTQAATHKNILSEFAAAGVWSLRQNFFEDLHFTRCEVTF